MVSNSKGMKDMENELSLKQMILNEIDNNPRGYADILAKIGFYSSGSALKKVLSDPKKEFDKFFGLIQITRHIWGNDSIKMMVKLVNECDPNKKTARNLLECLAINREFEAFNKLLDKMDECSNKESQEYSKVYRFQYKYELAKTEEDYKILLREITLIHVTVFELKVYQRMLLNYCYNKLRNFPMVKILSEEIEREIELIENEYIMQTYTIRSNEIMAYNFLKVENNPEAARNCADKIIDGNARPAFKAYANFVKGYSYLFTSYDETVKYLNIAIELYESLGRTDDAEDLKVKVEFAGVYWGKLEEVSYGINNVFMNIKKGIHVDLTDVKDNTTPEFFLYLVGLNDKNEKKLLMSVIKYVKRNDYFLADLAKIELLKNGFDIDILEEMTTSN
jgi:hypothetical protein